MDMNKEIQDYVIEIETKHHNDPFWGKSKENHSFRVEFGRKFAKVIHNSWGQNSVHCFIEIANGNIWKAASWKMPQKNGIRGNIKDTKRPIFGGDFYVR